MAVNIVIALTDAEQAKVTAWLDIIKPGLTNQQKVAFLEKQARYMMREALVSRVRAIKSLEHLATMDSEIGTIDAENPLAEGGTV